MIQTQVLNYLLHNRDSSIITANNLSEEYFSDYPAEFKFIKKHIEDYGNVPDLTTFLSVFPSFEVFEVHESLNYLLNELIKDKNKRFLAANFNKIRSCIMSDDVDAALQILRDASENITDAVSIQSVDILHDKTRLDAYLERIDNYDKYFISTGFPELDAIIGGWDVKEELATIVARPGLGKSWLLFKSAAAAAMQGKKVGLYSGEMSENKVGYRIDTLIGHVSNGALVHGGPSIKNEYSKYINELTQRVEGSIKVITPKMVNGLAGVSALRAFIEKEDLDILFVDQYSLLEDDRGGKSDSERTANIVKDMKTIQVIKKIPIIAVYQQNRETNENNTYDTNLVAQSDKISQYSTILIFLERKDPDLMRLHLVKSRDTENGKILTYRVDLNRGFFTFVPSEEGPGATTTPSNYAEDDIF